jgi:hypothetical protein
LLAHASFEQAAQGGELFYAKVCRAVRIEGLSEPTAARWFGIDARTVNKMIKFSVPLG